MPREQTHWAVALQSLDELGGTRIGARLRAHQTFLLLGAVAHDTPYYAMGKASSLFADVADRIHGVEGEDTTSTIRTALDIHRERIGSSELSFLAGALTHAVTDSVFHPWVYHRTGNYYDPDPELRHAAMIRHRALESEMDSFCQPSVSPTLRELIRRSRRTTRQLASMSCLLYFGDPDRHVAETTRTLRWHARLQWAFAQPTLRRIAHRIRGSSLQAYEPELVMFNPRPGAPSTMDREGPQTYRHPVTGELITKSIAQFEDRSVTRAATLLRTWGEAGGGVEGLREVLQDFQGPSLETGLVGVPVRSMRFFAENVLV